MLLNCHIIEQMLEPTLFRDSLDNFPLKWDHVNPLTFSEFEQAFEWEECTYQTSDYYTILCAVENP